MTVDLSCGGRLQVSNWVTPRKLEWTKEHVSKSRAGDRVAEAVLMEALTTTEVPFNLAHLASMQFLPNFDEAERKWKLIAGVREVRDFRPATLYSLNRQWSNDPAGEEPSGVVGGENRMGAPTIPEGSIYPYAYISGDVAQGAGVTKKGFKTDWTLEARINDGLGAIDELPSEMKSVALDTEEDDVFGALVTQGRTSITALQGGPVPEGGSVPANAAFSRLALIRALIELAERRINGRVVGTSRNGYNLIVPVGQKLFVDFLLNNVTLEGREETSALVTNQFSINGYNPLANVTSIESEYLTGSEWFVLPKPGGIRRPVLDRLELRGYKTPQLFVENLTGQYVGGGNASPWEGSFDADVITLKLRQFGGGTVWDEGRGILYSNGTGV